MAVVAAAPNQASIDDDAVSSHDGGARTACAAPERSSSDVGRSAPPSGPTRANGWNSNVSTSRGLRRGRKRTTAPNDADLLPPDASAAASAATSAATSSDDVRFSATATFGMGCYWGAEAAFAAFLGDHGATRVGYVGGDDWRRPPPPMRGRGAEGAEGAVAKAAKPLTLKEVKTGRHGHAEAVRVRYDPNVVSFDDLLEQFWANHDPCAKKANPKYRSVIFVHSDQQATTANASVTAMKRRLGDAVRTTVASVHRCTPAESNAPVNPEEHDGGSEVAPGHRSPRGEPPGFAGGEFRWWDAEEKDQMYLAKNKGASCETGGACALRTSPTTEVGRKGVEGSSPAGATTTEITVGWPRQSHEGKVAGPGTSGASSASASLSSTPSPPDTWPGGADDVSLGTKGESRGGNRIRVAAAAMWHSAVTLARGIKRVAVVMLGIVRGVSDRKRTGGRTSPEPPGA